MIKKGVPILGVIYVPVKEWLYYGHKEIGSFKIENGELEKLPRQIAKEKYVAVGSRSHKSPETEAYFKELSEEHGEIDDCFYGKLIKNMPSSRRCSG